MTKAAEVILNGMIQDAEIQENIFRTTTEKDPFGTGDKWYEETELNEYDLYIELSKDEAIDFINEWIQEESFVKDEKGNESYVRVSDLTDMLNRKNYTGEYKAFEDLEINIKWV